MNVEENCDFVLSEKDIQWQADFHSWCLSRFWFATLFALLSHLFRDEEGELYGKVNWDLAEETLCELGISNNRKVLDLAMERTGHNGVVLVFNALAPGGSGSGIRGGPRSHNGQVG